jgi:hypothetical protein
MTDTHTQRLRLEVTPERAFLAADWHGGQGSMLYAVASTGALTLGTRRPLKGERGEYVINEREGWPQWVAISDGSWHPMTDDEWLRDLVERLLVEVEHAHGIAWSDPDGDGFEDADELGMWANDLAQWLSDHESGN